MLLVGLDKKAVYGRDRGIGREMGFFDIVIVGFLMICIGFTRFFVMYIDNFGFFWCGFYVAPCIVDERVVICVIDYNDRFWIKNGYR